MYQEILPITPRYVQFLSFVINYKYLNRTKAIPKVPKLTQSTTKGNFYLSMLTFKAMRSKI
jgi:hypothetical protein